MGLREWRRRRGMTDPVRGEFRVSGSYFPHPGRTPMQTMVTGVVVADGVPPTPGETLDRHAIGETRRVLPVLLDRADPTRFEVLWDEVAEPDAQAEAREQAAADAARMSAGPQVRVGVEPTAPAVGRSATARLVAVADVDVPAHLLPGPTASLCDLTLAMTRPDGSGYTAQARLGFRSAQRRAALAVVGAPVPVRVDPYDETQVSVDVPAWNEAVGQPGWSAD